MQYDIRLFIIQLCAYTLKSMKQNSSLSFLNGADSNRNARCFAFRSKSFSLEQAMDKQNAFDRLLYAYVILRHAGYHHWLRAHETSPDTTAATNTKNKRKKTNKSCVATGSEAKLTFTFVINMMNYNKTTNSGSK